jgi:predicted mannosyl-3-phosphoglycerate phosphatase (HAD superfamily)
LRSSTTVVYCAVDELISSSAKAVTGFAEFLAGLQEANVPCVWLTARNRHQSDLAIRKLGRSEPFIGEGGCGVYLPEDYFHLKPPKTVRLGRFTCIPIASQQPAAASELDLLAEETAIEVVPLRSLTPRELSQNAGLPQKDAELLRQRDFDEYFFFAGAGEAEISRFAAEAAKRKLQLRPRGNLWSLAAGASVAACVRELSKLYERALRAHPFNVGVATSDDAAELFPACSHSISLQERGSAAAQRSDRYPAPLELPLFSADTWERALEAVLTRQL